MIKMFVDSANGLNSCYTLRVVYRHLINNTMTNSLSMLQCYENNWAKQNKE